LIKRIHDFYELKEFTQREKGRQGNDEGRRMNDE
jgi:hypothetical protein